MCYFAGLVVAQDYKRGQQLVADRDFEQVGPAALSAQPGPAGIAADLGPAGFAAH